MTPSQIVCSTVPDALDHLYLMAPYGETDILAVEHSCTIHV